MINQHIKSEKGMALALILMIFAVVSIIAAAGLTIALSQINQSVSNEKYVESYYVARSATDVVSVDIINKISELKNMQPDVSSSLEDTLAFETFKAHVDNMLTSSVVSVDGIVPGQTVESNIIVVNDSGKKIVSVTTTYVKDGRSSTSKVQLGEISPQSITVAGQKSAIYSWGNIVVGQNLTVVGDANIAYGGDSALIKKKPLDAEHSLRNVDIIVPPAVGIKSDSTTLFSTNKSAPKEINNSFNGNYGIVEGNYFDWNVNTNSGDVILIFNKLTINKASTINVTGANNLYIYLKENIANTGVTPLFQAKNDFSIVTSGTPKTYIISYTKSMQDIYNSTGDTNVEPNLLVPLDTVYIKNSAELDAFFYLPGCDFTIEEGSPNIKGSIFAGNFSIGNSANITFESYASDSVLNEYNTSTSQTETIETLVFSDDSASIKRIWVK